MGIDYGLTTFNTFGFEYTHIFLWEYNIIPRIVLLLLDQEYLQDFMKTKSQWCVNLIKSFIFTMF